MNLQSSQRFALDTGRVLNSCGSMMRVERQSHTLLDVEFIFLPGPALDNAGAKISAIKAARIVDTQLSLGAAKRFIADGEVLRGTFESLEWVNTYKAQMNIALGRDNGRVLISHIEEKIYVV